MSEISVTVLDVHEVESDFPGHARRSMEVFDNAAHFAISEEGIVRRKAQTTIQDWMTVENAWLGLS